MNIFKAGVMHAARATCQRIQRAFKNRAENSRRDSRPVETAGSLVEQEIFNFGREVWDFDCASEQAAIDERKFFQRVIEVGVAFVYGGIEYVEEVEQVAADISCAFEVVAKNFMLAKNA